MSAVRRLLAVLRLAGFAALIAVLIVANVAPRLGHEVLIIRGPSMEPAIPLGSLVFETTPRTDLLAPGAVVTFRSSNGVVITHRIVDGPRPTTADDIVDGSAPAGATVLTKGDANATPDPVRIPVGAVSGVVEGHVPLLGWVLAWLQLPTGLISVISLLGCLLAVEWLVEDDEEEDDLADPAGAAGPNPQPAAG